MILLKALDIGCLVSKKVSTYKITALKDQVCDIGNEFSSADVNTCGPSSIYDHQHCCVAFEI